MVHEIWTNLRLRVRALLWRRRLERDLEEELAFHLEMRGGAAKGFGNPVRLKEEMRDQWTFPTLESVWQDVRYAGRLLRRAPGFTAVAVLSLGLGIGANTAIFSLVNAVLLKTLPVADPQELRLVLHAGTPRAPQKWRSGYSMAVGGAQAMSSFSFAGFEQMKAALAGEMELMGFARSQVTVRAGAESHYGQALFLTAEAMNVLRLRPAAGRLLTAEDDRPGAAAVALVSDSYRQKRLGAEAVGRVVTINNRRVTVVGVLPAGFQGLNPGSDFDFAIPVGQVPELGPPYYARNDAEVWWLQVLGRLRPGVSEQRAAARLAAVFRQLDEQHAETEKAKREPWRPVLLAGGQGLTHLRRMVTRPLLVLAGVVAVVLLIACANLANLLLARSSARRRELAVRVSIGCSRARLVRQLLTESLVLAGLGAAFGLAMARPLAEACLALFAGGDELALEPALDGWTLAFTVGATVVTALLCGLWPAWRATARVAGGRAGGSRVLVLAQVALSTLLVVAAGLFLRSLGQLEAIDPGFRAANLVLGTVDATRSGYKEEGLVRLYERIEERLAAIPGVEAVTHSSVTLLSGSTDNMGFWLAGDRKGTKAERTANVMAVGPRFHEVVGIGLRQGRGVEARDTAAAGKVAVVNEAFVREFLKGKAAVGQILYANDAADAKPIEIVGVCADAKYDTLKTAAPSTVYFPAAQNPGWIRSATYELRTRLGAGQVAAAMRQAVAQVDANLPLAELKSQQAQIDQTLGMERLFAALVTAFGGVAVGLAALGLYGLLDYAVARRRAEIGIRLALGARRGQIQWLVLRDSLWMTVAGLAVGLPAAWGAARTLGAFLYGVQPGDWVSYAAVPVVLGGMGALAAWRPARAAAGVDPASSLKCE